MAKNSRRSHTYNLNYSAIPKLKLRHNPIFRKRQLSKNSDIWHEFKIIQGALYEKEEVLDIIMKFLKPVYLLPVKYHEVDNDSYFIAKNCASAIQKLCESNFTIQDSNGDPLISITLSGIVKDEDLNIRIKSLLLPIILDRYNAKTKSLDLEAFHKDSNLSNIIYCPLFHSKNLELVLNIAKERMYKFEYLNLKHNELETLDVMESFDFTSLKYIDLRFNNIMNLEDITSLEKFKITKLWLDGNPVCEMYSSVMQYINWVKYYYRHILEIDGVSTLFPKIPLTFYNYFKDKTKEELAYQFADYFFTLYDKDRVMLRGLYDRDAFYSMTCSIPFSITRKKILMAFTESRNILEVKDPNKRDKYLYYGKKDVLRALISLPKTYHDKSSFQYDVINNNDECVFISISGMFINLNNDRQALTFNRTFILAIRPDNEYLITNDQYNIIDAPENINFTKDDSMTSKEIIHEYFSLSKKIEMIMEFKGITKLNLEWSEMYLIKTNWDIHESIKNFMKDHESKYIPREAFRK